MTTPTTHQFTKYQRLYDYYNQKLFKGELPFCLLILSRNTARVCGHFSKDRWQDETGKTTHEINLNPVYMAAASKIEICQTLVHEMVHLWQFEFGKPSRTGYHNKEWANKMESIGLMPSHTGKEGGKKTGQQMDDYPIVGGYFEQAFKTMPAELLLPFKSREITTGLMFLSPTDEAEGATTSPTPQLPIKKPYRRNKAKYTCPCGTNIWGKPNLNVICGECDRPFEEAS